MNEKNEELDKNMKERNLVKLDNDDSFKNEPDVIHWESEIEKLKIENNKLDE